MVINLNIRKSRQIADLGITGRAAKWYDKNSRRGRIREMENNARMVAQKVPAGSKILEVAPGPGYMAIELARIGDYEIFGLDISNDMVEIAKHNSEEAGVNVSFTQCNVSNMPFPDETFDLVFCSAAFKNFKDPVKALNEVNRVLKDPGIAIIMDMRRDAEDLEIEKLLDDQRSKGISRIITRRIFKTLRKGAYSKDEFEVMIGQTNFRSYTISSAGIGFTIQLHKFPDVIMGQNQRI